MRSEQTATRAVPLDTCAVNDGFPAHAQPESADSEERRVKMDAASSDCIAGGLCFQVSFT